MWRSSIHLTSSENSGTRLWLAVSSQTTKDTFHFKEVHIIFPCARIGGTRKHRRDFMCYQLQNRHEIERQHREFCIKKESLLSDLEETKDRIKMVERQKVDNETPILPLKKQKSDAERTYQNSCDKRESLLSVLEETKDRIKILERQKVEQETLILSLKEQKSDVKRTYQNICDKRESLLRVLEDTVDRMKILEHQKVEQETLVLSLKEQKRDVERTYQNICDKRESLLSFLEETKDHIMTLERQKVEQETLQQRKDVEERKEEYIVPSYRMSFDSSSYSNSEVKLQTMCATGCITPRLSQKLWEAFLSQKNAQAIEALLGNNLLPRNEELTIACKIFGRDSKTVEQICSEVRHSVMAEYEDVLSVWPAYNADDENKVIFVAVRKNDVFGRIDYRNFDIVVRGERQTSSENRDVIENEIDTKTQIDTDTMLLLTEVINKNSPNLRQEHSNISIISASPFRSTGFCSGNHRFIKENCVVIFVHVKGLIPINEKPFPNRLENGNCGFGVDVREGTFQLHVGGRPGDKHKDLKMGCAIGPAEGQGFGTLGGFLDHKEYGLCGITCAHVLLEGDQLQHETPNPNIVCLQPHADVKSESPRCGILQHHIFRKGSEMQPGVDAALVKIDAMRKPLNGSFPDTEQKDLEEAGLQEEMTYTSGAVYEFADIRKYRDSRLIKYGAKTCLRRGVFGFAGLELAYSPLGHYGIADFKLNNQIQVYHIKQCGDFSEPGDSGSLVFSVSGDGLTAVGLLLGNCDAFSVVTPICDVLQAVGCSAPYSLKRFQENNNCEINKYNEAVGQ